MLRRDAIRHGEAVLLIAIGGILGSNLRYATGAVAGEALVSTLIINAVGSFGLGLLLFDARTADLFSIRTRYVFGTGFFASFTTYSTFIADLALTAPLVGILYLWGSYGMGIIGVLASKSVVQYVSPQEHGS